MIEANELRLGNYFIGYDDKIFQFGLNDFVAIGSNSIEIDEIIRTPILLTSEILEKCGFKYGKVEGISSFTDSEREGDTHYWDLSIKQTDFIDTHEISIVKWGEEEYFTFQLGRGTYRQRIKYVHQLQNLIYPLKGSELEVVW